MKTYFKLFLLGTCVFLSINQMKGQPEFSSKWSEVDRLESKGLIRSALDSVNLIFQEAKELEEYPNWAKAYIVQQRLKSRLEEEGVKKAIMRMEDDLADMVEPVNSIVHHFTGLYYSQLLSNRQGSQDRTEYASENETDIRTWSNAKLERRARFHLLAFLDAPVTKQLFIKDYSELFKKAKEVKWEASLYDYFLYASVKYFSNTSKLHESTNTYTPDAETWLADAGVFINTYLTSQDSLDYRYISSQLYQYWLSHHTETKNIDAFALVNANRLKYGHQLTQNDSFYEKALSQAALIDDQGACVYNYHLAQLYVGQGGRYAFEREEKYRLKLKEAYELAQSCKNCELVDSGCKEILTNLARKSYGISIEQINPINQAVPVSLRFRNVNKMYIHYFKLDEKTWFSNFYDNRGIFKIPQNVAYLKSEEILLPKEVDHQEHRVDHELDALDAGAYALIVSDKKNYNEINGPTANIDLQKIQISDMALIHKSQFEKQTYYIVDRMSGKPIRDARISIYQRGDYQHEGLGQYLNAHITNKEGRVERSKVERGLDKRSSRQNAEILVIDKKGDRLIVDQYFYMPSPHRPNDRRIVHFFTDRSIYRPGQTIHFKGLYLVRSHEGLHKIIEGEEVEVLFRNANGQEILKKTFTSNEFGSFSGSFEIPTGLINGSFSLSVNGSYHRIQVEEYKRPSFEATFDTLKGNYVIGQAVNISGSAKNLAGNPLSSAKIDYKVIRNTYFPYWHNSQYFNYCFPSFQKSKEVTYGEVTTDGQGKFIFDFLAEKNSFLNDQFKPINNYEVTITVTDITGESHDYTQHITVGPAAVKVEIKNNEIVDVSDKNGIELFCTNYNQIESRINGELTIDELVSPNSWSAERLLPVPDWSLASHQKNHPTWSYAKNEAEPSSWKIKRRVSQGEISIDKKHVIDVSSLNLIAGKYKVKFEGKDDFNNVIITEKFIDVADLNASKLPKYQSHFWTDIDNTYEVGSEVCIDIFSNEEALVLVSVDRKSGTQKSYWRQIKGEETLKFNVDEADRGNFKIDLLLVKGNRSYNKSYNVVVPYSHKDLHIEYLTFRDNLEPGQEEKWILKISGHNKDRIAAEMVASLYDASLDAFKPHHWSASFYPTNYLPSYISHYGIGSVLGYSGHSYNPLHIRELIFFPPFKNFGFPRYFGGIRFRGRDMAMMSMESEAEPMSAPTEKPGKSKKESEQDNVSEENISKSTGEIQAPLIRTNLKETVFFYPDLRTDEEGNVLIEFTMNEALTKWKLLTFAHTSDLQYVFDSKELVTSKDFMVFPLLPRFFREGDDITLKAKLVNLSDTIQEVLAFIDLKDITGSKKNSLFDIDLSERSVHLEPNESKIVQWKIHVPNVEKIDLTKVIIYAQSGSKSDGEEHIIPILSNRKLVTEALSLPLKRNEKRTWELEALKEVKKSITSNLHSYTVEISSNPAWYAVLALPYLDKQDITSTTGKMNQFYANQLASHVVRLNPAIVDVVNGWKSQSTGDETDVFLSQLEKNQALKNILLEQTPWVMQAKSEEEQRRRISLLFDMNTLSRTQSLAWKNIVDRQNGDGGFSWIPGGRSDWFTTLQILSSILQLQELDALNTQLPGLDKLMNRAIGYSDKEAKRQMDRIMKSVNQGHAKLSDNHLSPLIVLHMFVRGHFEENPKMTEDLQESFAFFKEQLEAHWDKQQLYQQGYIALTLSRLLMNKEVPIILKSIKERSLKHADLGRYWKQNSGYNWYQRPVETQALMIRVFHKLSDDKDFVDQLKTWLLKHKQTNAWGSGRASAESIHALLSTDGNSLQSGELIKAEVGSTQVEVDNSQAGLGYYSKTYSGSQMEKVSTSITLENPNDHIAWGAVYWQYFEDLDKITSYEPSPLKITKSMTKRIQTDEGYKLVDVDDVNLNVGDRVISRIEIRVDREMDYIHLQDLRSSGLEPENVISGYRWQDGLGYYQSSKDVSTEFFIRHMRPGTYVFEYPLKVSHEGKFSNGIATMQSYYAPEFVSHSQGEIIIVSE